VDTLALGGDLTVPHHPFVELYNWQGYSHEYDAALDLSPSTSLEYFNLTKG